MNKKENRYKIFEKIASSKSKYIVLMIIATYLLITLVPMFTYGFPDNSILGIVFSGIGLTIFFVFLFGKSRIISSNNKTYNSPLGTKILGSIMGLLFGGIPFGLILLPTLLQDNLYLIGYIFGVLCIGGMILALTYLPRRTAYGNEMLGKIGGFRNYLETAEKDQLEDMVLKEPTYFYNILPYAYVLGVSDKWIKKFETIALKAPDWYDSHNSFDMVSFGSFMNSTMKSALSVMSSSSSSDSGSSGGGSSGGGSGGGGGGSW